MLHADDRAVLLCWQETGSVAVSSDGAAADSESRKADEEQARVEEFLAAVEGMAEAGAAQQVSNNPYYGQTAVTRAFADCQTTEHAEKAVDALLGYWENAECRLAAESNLTRAKELLAEAQTALLSGQGSEAVVSQLQSQVDALESTIQTCTAEMSKASMTADSSMVDTNAVTLSVKTALVDLTSAYSSVQQAAAAYTEASTAAYTRQLSALNALTGGWVSRTQGWLTDALVPLYQTATL